MGKHAVLLTRRECRLMKIIWSLGKATTPEVWDAIRTEDNVAYTTVMSQLKTLEQKGLLSHTKSGKGFLYKPCISRQQATANHIVDVMNQYFDDRPDKLLRYLSEEYGVSASRTSGLESYHPPVLEESGEPE